MIKTLQKKFIHTAMIAITILIISMLGAINIANVILVSSNIKQRLEMLSDTEGDPNNIPGQHKKSDFRISSMQPKDDRDKMLSSNFFLVIINEQGQFVKTDTHRTSTITENEAIQLAQSVYSIEKTTGRIGKYRYKISDGKINNDKIIIFLDVTDENISYIRVLILSLLIGTACWAVMYLIVTILSKKAIRPIAENIEKQKQFITNAGHEIKTPLAIIQANSDAMVLYNGENKWTNNIKDQVKRLDGLMKNMLLLAKMDENQIIENKTAFSFTELLTQNYNSFTEAFKLKNITCTTNIEDDITITADKEHITQLISILLENALKYTNENGFLDVELNHSGKKVVLKISNTCEALPDVPGEKLFDRFYRADKSRNQKTGGYGIGLSVAQSIVLSNHGSIQAVYEADNKISFIVILPIKNTVR